MCKRTYVIMFVAMLQFLGINQLLADTVSIGVDGIDSASVPYTGNGISIGQVEGERPGKPGFDNAGNSNAGTTPKEVFLLDGRVDPTENSLVEIYADPNAQPPTDPHATQIAGVIISSDNAAPGVAQNADLYSTAGAFPQTPSIPLNDSLALSAQHIALQDGGDVRAINMSFLLTFQSGGEGNGNSLFTQFVDWSASEHDVLYVANNRNSLSPLINGQPLDNFNGITVAASERPSPTDKFRRFGSVNNPGLADASGRTHIDILAPGTGITVANTGSTQQGAVLSGSSLASPHVTGTVALLQEHGDKRIMEHAQNPTNAPNWGGVVDSIPSAHRHEVMKAVLMNSADKIEDTSNNGKFLGMTRTVQKSTMTDGVQDDWFDSEAFMEFDEEFEEFFIDTDTPLDEEIGVGHLNAKRALQQFIPGEHDFNGNFGTPIVGDVPLIGWDYGTIGTGNFPINKYALDTPLEAGNYISVTLAWDREVEFANDANMDGDFDEGDTFEDYTALEDVLTNLDLYLVPAGTNDVGDDDTAISNSEVFPVEHIFTEIPFDGDYEIWVYRNEQFAPAQDYGIAWWYGLAADIDPPIAPGDFDGDGDVDGADLSQWQGDYGLNPDSDADGDGDTDGAVFLAWQRNFTGPGAVAGATAIPEPSTCLLLVLGLPFIPRRFSFNFSSR